MKMLSFLKYWNRSRATSRCSTYWRNSWVWYIFFQVNPNPFPRGHLSRAGQFERLSVNTISNPGWKKIWVRQVTVCESFDIPLRDSWRNIAFQVIVILLDNQSSFLIRNTKHEVKKRVVMHGCQSHRQCRLALEEKIVWDKKSLVLL